jgi:Dynein heavy chain.
LEKLCIEETASLSSSAFKMPIIVLTPTVKQDLKFELDSTVFQCPLYRAPDRMGTLTTTGHSTNFVCVFEMKCQEGKTAKHWLKRGAALKCEPPE